MMELSHDVSRLNVSQESAGLSHSFTAAELHRKPRERRIATIARMRRVYMRASPSASSKTTMRLSCSYSRIHSRLTTAVSRTSVKEESPPARKVPSARFLSDVRNSTDVCKSDFFELRRDIATYEHSFLSSNTTLPALSSLSEFVPIVTKKSQEAEHDKRRTEARLKSAIRQLSTITKKVADAGEENCFQKTEFELKKPSAHYRMRTVFKGSRQVSGTYCLLHVRSNGWLTSFEISALTMDGTLLRLSLAHSIPGLCSESNQKETMKRLDACLMQRLYLTVSHNDLSLSYHPRSGLDFHEFPAAVKGLGLVAVHLQDSTLSIPPLEEMTLTVPYTLAALRAHVDKHLHFNAAKSQLMWMDPSARFAAKEADSRFMNSAYVTEKLGSFINRSSYITECEVDGALYSVELRTRGHRESLVISGKSGSREVKDLSYLSSLQFTDLSASWSTFLRSLELHFTIKKLFAELL